MGRQKKVCQLLHSLDVGGAEILSERIGRRLSSSYDVVFVCLDEIGELGQKLIKDGYDVKNLARGKGIDFGCIGRLARLMKSEGVDVIHAHQYTPFFYALGTRVRGLRRPVLFTEHGRFHPDYPSWKRKLFNRLFLAKNDRCVAVGKDVRRALVENEGLPENRIDVIYNGVDTCNYESNNPTVASEVRKELGVPDGWTVVTQIARLDYLKDHVTAIQAIEKVIRSNPETALLLVGEGPERSKIENEISRRNLGPHVKLLGLRTDIPDVLAMTDVVMLTSISEGIPLTLIEGMAARRAIVSTDVGGVREVVQDQQTGLLAPAKDSDRIAKLIVQLANEPAFRQRLASAGQKLARERFDEENMFRSYESTIADMLKE